MWTKSAGYRSFFLLIRLRIGNGFLIPIPIPLFLLDQTLDIIEDLAWLAEKFTPARSVRWRESGGRQNAPWVWWSGSPTLAVKLCREMVNELRRYGKWRMMEVDAHDKKKQKRVRVYVDFI